MPRRFCSSPRRLSIAALHVVLTVLLGGTAWSQTTVDPQVIEFIPSDDSQSVLADGTSAVTRYDVEIAVAGTTQVLQRISLGKPSLDPDGMIRANFKNLLTVSPAPGVAYDSRILTVGPQGTTPSTRSNSFTFTAPAPSQPQTIDVTTSSQLQSAVAALTSNTTLRLAPGIYNLTAALLIRGSLSGVVLKGSTGNPDDVVINGQGMTVNGTVPTAVSVSGSVQDLQIADLTIQNVYKHAVLFDNGPQAPLLSNLRLIDCGDACVKANLTAGAPVNNGIVESSWIGYTTTGAATTAGGIDLHGARGWSVRGNSFSNVRGPSGQSSRPAVAASEGSADTRVERNMFANASTAIALGLANPSGSSDHSGGRIANNFVYRAAAVPGAAGISVASSPNTVVASNTIVQSGTYASGIEYRYPSTTNLTVANNLVDSAITMRDGAAATLAGNITGATTDLFVNPGAGDLHLRPTASAAIDLASASSSEAVDIDNEARPKGLAPDVGADEVDRQNLVPTVQVTSPISGAIYKLSAAIPLAAQAADPDGEVASVEFYVNSTLVGTATTAPYTLQWTTNRAGTYSVIAVAVDNLSGRASSQPVTITVNRKGR